MHQETFKGIEITAPTEFFVAQTRDAIDWIMFRAEGEEEELVLAKDIVKKFKLGIIWFYLHKAGVRIRLAEMLKSLHD